MTRILFILIFLLAATCHAQEFKLNLELEPLLKLPVGLDYDMDEDGTNETKCLSTPQWQQVMAIAVAYQGLYRWRLKIHEVLIKYHALQTDYENLKHHQEFQVLVLKDQVQYAEEALAKNVKARKVERFLLWGIIALQSVFIAVGAVKGVD